MKIRVSNSLFVILVSAVLWQPVSAAADSYDPPARVARLSYSQGSVSFQPAGDSEPCAADACRCGERVSGGT